MSKIVNSKARSIRMWIHGKCFSVNKFNPSTFLKMPDDEIEENISLENYHEITEDSGKFITTFRLPKSYYAKIHNMPDFCIKELSDKTGIEIILPEIGQDGEVAIHSDSKMKLLKAVDQIHSVAAEIRRRYAALQFVCIPCLSQSVQESFEKLKKDVLDLGIPGVHESIFQCPKKLHLTINVCVLLDETEKNEAVNALNSYKTEVLDQLLGKVGPLKLDIAGLDCMNGNVKKVNVLYAKAKIANESGEFSLQSIVNGLSNHLYHRGLNKEYQENVKLHMTIMNTKYRKVSGSPKRKCRRLSFDATKIIEKYKDYTFGQCNFDSIHLSHITSKGDDGFYKPVKIIKLGF
ncbi:activating signal cointegrator 1 complex subunit 1-like [Cylas formicarius]|uniref:activating signal cointegrator 1 complex subunit 1-like n=1 Tax=Cylas formicarius TaxID=197179 RepID=UPI002958BAEC|nr:activating signal cointegrator 1 complex subunit 1-like [Cylas formicarius]